MDSTHLSLIAMARDVFAFILLLNDFQLIVLAVFRRELSNKVLVGISFLFVIVMVGLLDGGRGIFASRLPAAMILVVTISLGFLVRARRLNR